MRRLKIEKNFKFANPHVNKCCQLLRVYLYLFSLTLQYFAKKTNAKQILTNKTTIKTLNVHLHTHIRVADKMTI